MHRYEPEFRFAASVRRGGSGLSEALQKFEVLTAQTLSRGTVYYSSVVVGMGRNSIGNYLGAVGREPSLKHDRCDARPARTHGTNESSQQIPLKTTSRRSITHISLMGRKCVKTLLYVHETRRKKHRSTA